MQLIQEIRLSRKRPDPNNPDSGKTWHEKPIAVVRSNCYGSTLDYFDRLHAALTQQFPEATRTRIEVKHYGGDRISGTFGIEYSVPYDITEAPQGWSEIQELEYTR